jgi:hypothetical protein
MNSYPTSATNMIEFEALTIVNIGKGHYMPGQKGFVTPSRFEELETAGLVKKVGTGDVPKEARADDGAYAEEKATELVVDLTRTKVAADLPIEKEVAAIPEAEAKKDNEAIAESEEAKDDLKTGVKEDKTLKAQTKEDKTAPKEATK